MTQVRLADLDPAGHTSFSFYEFLPGEGYEVEGAPPASAAVESANRLLGSDLLTEPDLALDRFAALLLTHGAGLPPDGSFVRLAAATAQGFAALLGDDAQRARRMRLTRLSLMLRVVLDAGQDTSAVMDEAVLPCKSPWDFVPEAALNQAGWTVSCDNDNLRRLRQGQVKWSRRTGLPTQLDRLGDDLWVGSHYSNGGHLVRHGQRPEPELVDVAHTAPLVLAFDAGNERWALDFTGGLWRLDGAAIGRKLLQLPHQVHRARVIGSTLYAFDWGQAGQCVQVNLDALQARVVATGDIIVCNDVCGHQGLLYGICKLQGRVFKMDADWTPLDTRLGAGGGAGQLLDPIMIRCDRGRLSVLNWFSARLVQLDAF